MRTVVTVLGREVAVPKRYDTYPVNVKAAIERHVARLIKLYGDNLGDPIFVDRVMGQGTDRPRIVGTFWTR